MKHLAVYRHTWQVWRTRSLEHRILRAVLTVGLFSGAVKIIVLFKELAVAWRFGIGDSLDVFFTGLLVPGMISTIVAGSMYAAFMPTYVQVAESKGADAARRLLADATVMSAALLAMGALLVGLFAPFYLPFFAKGFGADKLAAALHILYLFLPWVVISGVQSLWSATLNSTERFALAASAPVVTPLLILLALWLNQTLTPAGLAIATTAGALLETGVLFVALRRRGLWANWGWHGLDAPIRQIGRQLAPLVAGSIIMTSTILVDQYFAGRLPAGSVATLSYGNRLVSFILTFVTATLGTALFPYYSRLAATHDWAGLRSLLLRYVGVSTAIAIPATAIMYFASDVVVALMYQRNAFTAEAAQVVAEVQRLYTLQAPFYIAAILCVRLISALRYNTVLMIGAVGNLGVSIAANSLLAPTMGVAGIALAAVCVYIFSFTFLFSTSLWVLHRQMRRPLAVNPK